MPRANRYFVPGFAYHLIHRCHNRQFLLRLAKDRECYRMLLREVVLEFGISLLDFCVTSHHTHLLAYAEEGQPISAFLQKVEGEFAQAYNRCSHRSGALWSDRFHPTIIEPGGHLERCMVYIGLNMVRCGAVGSERFVPEIASRIRGRQKLEVVGEADRWERRELGGLYQVSRGPLILEPGNRPQEWF